MQNNTTPYIARIVEIYKTTNGNLFCREEGKQELDHHLDWEIFIPEHLANKIQAVPFWGIIVTDYHIQYFNKKSRLTCRVFSNCKSELDELLNEQFELENEIKNKLIIESNNIELFYSRDIKCDKAIQDIKTEININTWLLKYKELFEIVSIKPDGLPAIANANLNGTNFRNIQKFVSLYETLSNL